MLSVACVAAKLNAELNNVNIEISSENLLENRVWRSEWSSDVILVGDLLYDEEIADALIPRLEEASLRNGSRIYLGDPGRHALTEALKSRMKLRKRYSLPENVRKENYGYNAATVWQFNSG